MSELFSEDIDYTEIPSCERPVGIRWAPDEKLEANARRAWVQNGEGIPPFFTDEQHVIAGERERRWFLRELLPSADKPGTYDYDCLPYWLEPFNGDVQAAKDWLAERDEADPWEGETYKQGYKGFTPYNDADARATYYGYERIKKEWGFDSSDEPRGITFNPDDYRDPLEFD